MSERKRVALVVGITTIYFLSFFGPYWWYNVYSVFLSEQDIIAVSDAISSNETDPLVIMNKIADWLDDNMKWDSTQYSAFPFYLRKSHPPANWVMAVKRGACGENAILFAELARNSGFESRVVRNTGEDHVWNEVWINVSWTHFDATLSEENRFDNPGFYERPRDEGGWGKQLSYVYSTAWNGTISNVTSKYTATGNLVVSVERDGVPVENARVIARSRFLAETRSDSYKQALFAVDGYTDQEGVCSFNLGENNYTLVAELGDERAETSATLLEGTRANFTLRLEKSGISFSFPPLLVALVATCAIIILASATTYRIVELLLARTSSHNGRKGNARARKSGASAAHKQKL